jgi:hypothetical protein
LRPFQRRLAALPLAAIALAIAGTNPPDGLAFPISGCALAVTSQDADGVLVDRAFGGGLHASQEAPLQANWDGTLSWSGTTGAQAIRTTSWHVELFGMPTPLRGGDPNDDGDTSGDDSIRISEAVPFRFTGLFHVSGQLSGEGGTCSGAGWVRVLGDPMSTLPFLVALALLLVGVVLLAVGLRGRWLPATAGGLLLGLGSMVMLVIYAALPLGETTPLAVTMLGLVMGAAAGLFGRMQLRRTQRAARS